MNSALEEAWAAAPAPAMRPTAAVVASADLMARWFIGFPPWWCGGWSPVSSVHLYHRLPWGWLWPAGVMPRAWCPVQGCRGFVGGQSPSLVAAAVTEAAMVWPSIWRASLGVKP